MGQPLSLRHLVLSQPVTGTVRAHITTLDLLCAQL
jgi:hypothetical protein